MYIDSMLSTIPWCPIQQFVLAEIRSARKEIPAASLLQVDASKDDGNRHFKADAGKQRTPDDRPQTVSTPAQRCYCALGGFKVE